MSTEPLNHIVSGAIYDFVGFLTTRDERMTLSATDNPAPVANAVKAFLTLRGVDQNCEPFFQWPCRCSAAPQDGLVSPVGEAISILKSAMRDDPQYARAWHCNVAVAMTDEGAPQDSANAAAARVMSLLFDVDTSKAPVQFELSDMPVPQTEEN